MNRFHGYQLVGIIVSITAALLLTSAAIAQNYTAPSTPVLGSANTVTANAPVPRPTTQPCTVTLFQNLDFADFNPKFFSYTPPASCPGPWAAVVLEADWSVDAGRQFDRTSEIWLGGANIFFGTTAEPSANVQRSWHTESNLTEYTPLFTIAQQGRVDLGNLVNQTYTSHIHGSAYLQFYPLAQGQSPPHTASLVLPLSASPSGGTVTLSTPSDQLAQTFTLPTNVERAYLNVFAQGQQGDEFWYSCAPDDVAAELFNCGSTGFREAEVSIDAAPAGVAPVYPWIFTGGIDPYLWRPVPGVHTLNFEPYRVDLTPFAAMLSDGQPHTIAVNVYNADHYFSATANLLLYQDAGSSQVTGALTSNTLSQPDPVITENLTSNGPLMTGTVNVVSNRGFTIEGYVQTSHGTVNTKVVESVEFSNAQRYLVKNDGSIYDQTVDQTTTIASSTTSQDSDGVKVESKQFSWPLTLNYDFNGHKNGAYQQLTRINQGFNKNVLVTLNGATTYSSSFSDAVAPSDMLLVNAGGQAGPNGQTNSETYQYSDSTGACWDETVRAQGGILKVVQGGNCQSDPARQ
jgi:hypothetical protein